MSHDQILYHIYYPKVCRVGSVPRWKCAELDCPELDRPELDRPDGELCRLDPTPNLNNLHRHVHVHCINICNLTVNQKRIYTETVNHKKCVICKQLGSERLIWIQAV